MRVICQVSRDEAMRLADDYALDETNLADLTGDEARPSPHIHSHLVKLVHGTAEMGKGAFRL